MIIYKELTSVRSSEICATGDWLFTKKLLEISSKKVEPDDQFFPLIIEKNKDKYNLVLGYEFYVNNSFENVQCLIVDIDDYQKGILNLHFFASYFKDAHFFLVPIRYFYKKLGVEEKLIYKVFNPFLEPREIRLLLKWCNFPSSYNNLVIKGHISVDVVDSLEKFSDNERELLLPFFENLIWGKNKSKLFLEGLNKLKKREKKDLSELIKVFLMYLKKDLSPNDKIQLILDKLRDELYPNYRKFEKEFLKRSMELIKDNKNIKIIPSKSFELDEIYLEYRLSNNYLFDNLIDDLLKNRDKWNNFLRWYLSNFS